MMVYVFFNNSAQSSLAYKVLKQIKECEKNNCEKQA